MKLTAYSAAVEMNIIVSMQKMNACMKLQNQSKYKEMTAGMPTVRNGIAPSH